MQFYLISDNVDTRIGMRLSGIDGVVVHDKENVIKELENASDNDEIAVVLLTNKIVEQLFVDADEHIVCDLGIGAAFRDHSRNFPFPFCQEVPDIRVFQDFLLRAGGAEDEQKVVDLDIFEVVAGRDKGV